VPSYLVPTALMLLGSLSLGMSFFLSAQPPVVESTITNRPIQVTGDGYVSSDTCQACHPTEYESWYGSFHRTMTQVATENTVRADFDGVRVNNVQSNQFDLFLSEPSNLNGIHGAAETITYVVLEAGSHVLESGTFLEVGTVNTNATVGKVVASPAWETVTFETPNHEEANLVAVKSYLSSSCEDRKLFGGLFAGNLFTSKLYKQELTLFQLEDYFFKTQEKAFIPDI